MIPVKDDIPREGFPLVTAILITLAAIGYLLGHRGGLFPLLLDAIFLGLLGPTVEDSLGRERFGALCLFSGLLGGGAWALLGGGWPSPAPIGATSATLAVLSAYLLLHPRARVLSLVPIPFFTTLVEVPATLLIGLWLGLQVYFGAAGLG